MYENKQIDGGVLRVIKNGDLQVLKFLTINKTKIEMNDKKVSDFPDPFEEARINKGVSKMNDQEDPVMMLLRHEDVRKTARNWKAFTSEAVPGRIVIPSEVNIRKTRQIPFELDPPLHKAYRGIVEEWFRRPLHTDYQAQLSGLISSLIASILEKEITDVVGDFALPLQSRALALLLNIPYTEAEIWISWGTHVFRSEGEALDGSKAAILYDYIDAEIEKAIISPGEDLYSVLLASDIGGRKLSKEEVKGIMVLVFAGGRDTVINTITNAIAYFAEHPQSLKRIKEQPEIVGKATEEFIRYFSPLTQMGRVVTEDTYVCEHAAKAATRVSLSWASANRDESVFENPNEVVLDRKANPHVGFGFATHNCLGATHTRELLKLLLIILSEKVESIEIQHFKENIENLGEFKRKVGFHQLSVKFIAAK